MGAWQQSEPMVLTYAGFDKLNWRGMDSSSADCVYPESIKEPVEFEDESCGKILLGSHPGFNKHYDKFRKNSARMAQMP